MKLDEIIKKEKYGRLSNRLPNILKKLPANEAFMVHDLLKKVPGVALNSLRDALVDMPNREQYKARVGRDYYYGNPEAILKLKASHGQG